MCMMRILKWYATFDTKLLRLVVQEGKQKMRREKEIIMICLSPNVQIDEISLPVGCKTTIIKRPKRCNNLYL